jgi:hypothetical protein
MKTYARYALLFSVCCLALLIAGCLNPFNERSSIQTFAGKGFVTIQVGDGAGRTLLPGAIFTRYELIFTAPEKETITLSSTDAVQSVELEPGDWLITAKGFVFINTKEYEAASGSKAITVAAGEELAVPVPISAHNAADGPEGFFRYDIRLQLDKESLSSATLVLLTLAEDGDYEEEIDLMDDDAEQGSLTLTPGFYLLNIRLEKASQNVGRTEAVHIYSNLETRAEYTFRSSDFTGGTSSVAEGDVFILQTYGTGTATDGAVSHTFVELYNKSESAVNLDGWSLQYADGSSADAAEAAAWAKIDLTGSIPAHGSYLMLGQKNNDTARLQIDDADANVTKTDWVLSNRSYKVALMANQTLLTVANPFDTDGAGTKSAGYMDLAGVINSAPADGIDAYETAYAEIISKQKAVRRSSLNDTDDNSADFIAVDYRASGAKDWEVAAWRPRGSVAGAWDPFAEPEEPAAASALLIFQVYGTGPNTQDGSVSHTFVELYNNTDTTINLGTYSLQYADGISSNASSVAAWTKIDLTGTIPAYGSYLICGVQKNIESGTIGRLQVATPDLDAPDFILSNRSYKIALMSNQTLLTTANPFDTDGSGTKTPGYVDLVGAINTAPADSIDAYETEYAEIISKQKSARRSSLLDTNDNSADLTAIDFRTADIDKFKPRNASAGAWTPEF